MDSAMKQLQAGYPITVGDMRMEQTMLCLSNTTSTDSQFLQAGEYREELMHGCYHNLQKPAAD